MENANVQMDACRLAGPPGFICMTYKISGDHPMPETGVSEPFKVPVLLIVFNRPATTSRVFDRIAKARPTKLLIVADGPRSDRSGEGELCQKVREIVSAV